MEHGFNLHEKFARTNYVNSKKVLASNASKGIFLLSTGTTVCGISLIC